ncbi:MAG: hypothetical protein VKP57_04330 [Candidatus Sericytochromatia bacterium]|nr:hypothetical protein [Candidatus Sericytochromatia bacterium]
MDDIISRGVQCALELLPQAPWPAPELKEDELPRPKKARTGPLGKAEAALVEAPAWLRAYERAPWAATPQYQQRIERETIWPLYDLIIITPSLDKVPALTEALVDALAMDAKTAEKMATAAVLNPVPAMIAVPKEATDLVRKRLAGLVRTEVPRSVWDKL